MGYFLICTLQNLSEANEKLEVQNKQMQKNLKESAEEMEQMTDEYNRMKLIVQQTDKTVDQFKREKDQLLFQARPCVTPSDQI